MSSTLLPENTTRDASFLIQTSEPETIPDLRVEEFALRESVAHSFRYAERHGVIPIEPAGHELNVQMSIV